MKKIVTVLVLFGIWPVFFSCRSEEDNRPRIEKIEFETENKSSIEGDTVKITVTAEPIEAKKYDTIKYWASNNSIIEIMPESNNDYVVFRGLKQGRGIIKASVNGMDIFCDVTVISSNGTLIPYIAVSDYVIESERGQSHQIIASLIGGLPADNNDFVWNFTGQGKNIINLTANHNIAVIDTVNAGDSVVTVSHKKALFEVSTLVFVREKNEIPIYISTGSNVINMRLSEELKEYSVNLFGKNKKDTDNNNYHLFRHEIVDVNDNVVKGSGVIELQSKNNVGTIKPKAKGIAKIRVSHQDADYPIEIVVIVDEAVGFKYIDTEDTVVIMEEGEFMMIRSNIIGEAPDDYIEKFEYINENNDIINISSSQNIMSIKALKKGKSVITIKNEYVDFDKEILIIVNGIENIIDLEKYITTNQNVITAEVNAEVLLTMTLVGGNSADANNFVWTVDDGSIIEVTNQHGSVKYKNRSMITNEEKFEATAMIRAKKIGTTTITLENPKAKNSFQVVVKVYKQGVFGVVPVVLSGSGRIEIEKGNTTEVNLRVATGLEKSMTNVKWESSDSSIFSVNENTNLRGILEGKKDGIATLTVTGDNFKSYYNTTVIVGDYADKPYIYVNNTYITLIKGNSVSFRINCINIFNEEINNLSVVNNSPNKIEVNSFRNNVIVKGLSFGEGEIVISGDGLNTLKVRVMVEDYALTPEIPYYLRTEKYIYGMVKGNSVEIQVDLVGGIAVNEKSIGWEIRDENIASIKGNGKKCIITGKNEGQTILKVSHYQAQNQDVEIVIYVVLSDAELKNKVVVHVSEQNIMLRQGETRFISIITNANEKQNDFRWGNGNANVIGLRVNGDKKSAFIEGVTPGNATLTAGYGDQLPFVIYVSVINETLNSPYINVPSIVEMVAGRNITVNAITGNVYGIYQMTWVSQDESIAKAYGNGDKCTITAFKSGKTVIEVRYQGFVKDIVLYVYDNADEMAGAYIFAGDQSRYVINKGDVVNIGLVFGMKGYPEHDTPNIRWTTSDSSKIELKGNGKTASVKGLLEGFWKVRAADNYGNDIEIEIAVKEAGKAGKYFFSIDSKDRIKGMLAGTDVIIPVKVVNSEGNEVYNVSGMEYTVENSDIINVERKEGGVKVYAKPGKEGQSYITITHDLAEDGKILIYTSLTENGLANAFPIMVEKSNYMITKGDAFNLKIQTINDNSGKLVNINYRLEKENGVISIQERNKKEIAVNAEKEGSEVILIYYNANVVQRVYVSVMEKGYSQDNGYMTTENIIGLVINQVYETRIDTDLVWNIEWKSENSNICEIIEIDELDGKRAKLKANGTGETVITVKCNEIERYILVFVVNSEGQLKTYNAVNIDQRKYKIPKGMDITVNLYSYQGKVEGETRFEDYFRYSVSYGNVITVNKTENDRISVKGTNEGIAAIRITNSFYNSDIIVYVEVYPVNEGEIGINAQGHYITAEKTLYILSSEMREAYIQVSVLPRESFYGDSFWEWKGYDESIISVEAMGRGAIVKGITEGETKIKVQNQKCEGNGIEITIIVGERFIIDSGKIPYIYVEKDVFEMVKGSGDLSIPYSMINVDNIIMKNITFNVVESGINVTHDVENGIFNVEAVNTGITRFEIIYGDLRKNVYVLVKENLNVGNIYFTTSENFVVANIGEIRNVNVNLMGYDEIDSSKIKWSISETSPKNIIQLVGNGLIGQIYGVAEGSVVINVSHERDDIYSLSINVKIVKDKSKENVVYLTTQRNIIETVEGSSEEMIYIQKVGGDPVKNKIDWIVDNANIVSLMHTGGYSARMTVRSEGTTKITARNIEAAYDLNIVVVVRKSTGSNIYISSDSNLLWLSPGYVNHKLSVSLVNGEEKDYNRITWSIDKQITTDPSVPAGSNVIKIISSNEQCYIDAVNVGTAYLRVECKGKADLPLIITVYVSHFREINFGMQHKDVVIGEMEIVDLELPTYEKLKDKARVWAEDLGGGSTDVVNVYYTNSIVMIQGLKKGNAVIKAAVDGKEGYAQMTVTVIDSYSDVNRIIVSKNIYVVSDSSGQFAIEASVVGPNIIESDLDNIEWEITRNYKEDDASKKPLISIFPQNMLPSTTKSTGKKLQITPQNLGNAVIRVGHRKVTQGYWKDIYIVVAKTDDKFVIVEPSPVKCNTSREAETISVNIIGGTNKDYEQVRWVALMQPKWDGTMLEIVRIMGSGKQVLLMPVNNGTTEVWAFYNGSRAKVDVECVSDYYFNVANTNELLYPTEERDISFEISPASNYVTWMYTPPETGPVVSVDEIAGSAPGGAGTTTKMIRITALKEGTATVIGMPVQGRPAMITIVVKYDFELVIDGKTAQNITVFNQNTQNNPNNSAPKYAITKNGVVTESSNGVIEFKYTVYPGNTYLKLVEEKLPVGLSIEISRPQLAYTDYKGRKIYEGTIKLIGTREMNDFIQVQLYQQNMSGGDDIKVQQQGTKTTLRTINVKYWFNSPDPLHPIFIRGGGYNSNLVNFSTSSIDAKNTIENAFRANKAYYKKNGKVILDGEVIKYSVDDTHMSLADGEEHYIIFDKKYESQNVTLKGIAVVGGKSVNVNTNSTNSSELALHVDDQKAINFTAQIVDLTVDGEVRQAIRLSGGNDYIDYTRVKFNKELIETVSSNSNMDRTPTVTYYNVLRDLYQYSPTAFSSSSYITDGVKLPHGTPKQNIDDSITYNGYGKYTYDGEDEYGDYVSYLNFNMNGAKAYYNASVSSSQVRDAITVYYDSLADVYRYHDDTNSIVPFPQGGDNALGAYLYTHDVSQNMFFLTGRESACCYDYAQDFLYNAGGRSSRDNWRSFTVVNLGYYGWGPLNGANQYAISEKLGHQYVVGGVFSYRKDENIKRINYGLYRKLYLSYGYKGNNDKSRAIFSEKYAQNMLRWYDNTNSPEIIVPYYIFNRFPYRFETHYPDVYKETNRLLISISEGGGKPMPSTNRNEVSGFRKYITLSYSYEKINNNGQMEIVSNPNDVIKIACIVRPSQFEYFGKNYENYDVTKYHINSMPVYDVSLNMNEIEGPINDFASKDSEGKYLLEGKDIMNFVVRRKEDVTDNVANIIVKTGDLPTLGY